EGGDRILIFTNTREEARRLEDRLTRNRYDTRALTGDVDQKRRLKILNDFKEGRLPVLVATDVASRGLHIEAVSHVVNWDLPQDAEAYVRRIGRTARAGAGGKAVALVDEASALYLEPIEKFIGQKIPVEWPDDDLFVAEIKPTAEERRRFAEARRARLEARGGRFGDRGRREHGRGAPDRRRHEPPPHAGRPRRPRRGGPGARPTRAAGVAAGADAAAPVRAARRRSNAAGRGDPDGLEREPRTRPAVRGLVATHRVGVDPAHERQVVGEELERNHGEDRREELRHRRNRDRLRRERRDLAIVLPDERDDGRADFLRDARDRQTPLVGGARRRDQEDDVAGLQRGPRAVEELLAAEAERARRAHRVRGGLLLVDGLEEIVGRGEALGALAGDRHPHAAPAPRLGERLDGVPLAPAVAHHDDAGPRVGVGPVALELERVEGADAVAETARVGHEQLADERRVPRGPDAREEHALRRPQAKGGAVDQLALAARHEPEGARLGVD